MRCMYLATALFLTSVVSSQEGTLSYHRGGPSGRAHYDLATGRLTKVVRPREVAHQTLAFPTLPGIQRASVNSFNNTLATGYFATLPLGGEFIDWASKTTGGPFMTAYTFGYGTTMQDTASGGPGASLDLSFYSGTSGGGGVCILGTEIGRSVFTGLPGATSSLPPGFGVLYNVTAFLASGLCVPDGQIGWGYTAEDSDGMGGSATGPRLTDFGTNTGWTDSYQWYADPASLNTCVGTFWFGGCSTGNVPPPGTGGTPCASFLLGISEYAPATTAACVYRNTVNPPNLLVIQPPSIGGSFAAVTQAPIAAYALTAGPLPGIQLSGVINGALLCDPTIIFGGIQVALGVFSSPVPKDPGLEGLAFCIQAAEFLGLGNFALTNAFDCLFGAGAGNGALVVTATVEAVSEDVVFTVADTNGKLIGGATLELSGNGYSTSQCAHFPKQKGTVVGTTNSAGSFKSSGLFSCTGPGGGSCAWGVKASKAGYADGHGSVTLSCP